MKFKILIISSLSAVLLSGCTTVMLSSWQNDLRTKPQWGIAIKDTLVAIGYSNDLKLKDKIILAGKANSYIISNPDLTGAMQELGFNNIMLDYYDPNDFSKFDSNAKSAMHAIKLKSHEYKFNISKFNDEHSFDTTLKVYYYSDGKSFNSENLDKLKKHNFSCSSFLKIDNSSQFDVQKLQNLPPNGDNNFIRCERSFDINVTLASKVNNLDQLEYKFEGERNLLIYTHKSSNRGAEKTLNLLYPLTISIDLITFPVSAPLGFLMALGEGMKGP